ncbi:MAG TPA: SMP-30/gluconolactonase/LRE family protein [Egibacteraceae bacterium]|nr:SMP-30/gluconolactonase/LRE family protein [Egibacteraceae bacterium]
MPPTTLDVYESDAASLMDTEPELERLADGFLFAEGPIWDFARSELIFSDIPGDAMHRYAPGEGASVYRKPSNFANGMTLDLDGRLVVCEHRTRRVVRGRDDEYSTVADRYQGRRLNAPNDVVVARDGSIVFTDPHYGLGEGFGGPAEQEQPHRGVYRIPPDGGEPILLVDDCDGPNGLALAPEERDLLVADTERGHIRRFAIGDDWTLSGGEVLVELPGDEGEDGVIDGLKVDEAGRIYSTGPGGVWICSPDGAVLGRLRISEIAANLAWGDADAATLYITASTSLYRVPTKVTGYAPHRALA